MAAAAGPGLGDAPPSTKKISSNSFRSTVVGVRHPTFSGKNNGGRVRAGGAGRKVVAWGPCRSVEGL